MTSETERRGKACPYFSRKLRACGLDREGIYLPPTVHVLTYCMSPRFFRCSVYTQFVPLEDPAFRPEVTGSGNRRRFKRISDRKKVLIRTCSPDGIVVGDFAELAVTSDYSQQGMRVQTKQSIPQNSYLLFDFDSDFLIPRLQGLAELRWYRRHDEGVETVEAGLAFRDEYSRKALGLVMEEPFP